MWGSMEQVAAYCCLLRRRAIPLIKNGRCTSNASKLVAGKETVEERFPFLDRKQTSGRHLECLSLSGPQLPSCGARKRHCARVCGWLCQGRHKYVDEGCSSSSFVWNKIHPMTQDVFESEDNFIELCLNPGPVTPAIGLFKSAAVLRLLPSITRRSKRPKALVSSDLCSEPEECSESRLPDAPYPHPIATSVEVDVVPHVLRLVHHELGLPNTKFFYSMSKAQNDGIASSLSNSHLGPPIATSIGSATKLTSHLYKFVTSSLFFCIPFLNRFLQRKSALRHHPVNLYNPDNRNSPSSNSVALPPFKSHPQHRHLQSLSPRSIDVTLYKGQRRVNCTLEFTATHPSVTERLKAAARCWLRSPLCGSCVVNDWENGKFSEENRLKIRDFFIPVSENVEAEESSFIPTSLGMPTDFDEDRKSNNNSDEFVGDHESESKEQNTCVVGNGFVESVTYKTFPSSVLSLASPNSPVLLQLYEDSCFLCFLLRPFINSLSKIIHKHSVPLTIKRINIERNDFPQGLPVSRGSPTFLLYRGSSSDQLERWEEFRPWDVVDKICKTVDINEEAKREINDLSARLPDRISLCGKKASLIRDGRHLQRRLADILLPSLTFDTHTLPMIQSTGSPVHETIGNGCGSITTGVTPYVGDSADDDSSYFAIISKIIKEDSQICGRDDLQQNLENLLRDVEDTLADNKLYCDLLIEGYQKLKEMLGGRDHDSLPPNNS